MTDSPTHVAPGSDRVRLAVLALDAALSLDGVASPDAGPHGMHVTASRAGAIVGALVVAEPGGRYSIDLGLRARLVPLDALADTVRESVTRAVTSAGLEARLGAISVIFHDVTDPTTETL